MGFSPGPKIANIYWNARIVANNWLKTHSYIVGYVISLLTPQLLYAHSDENNLVRVDEAD